MDKPLNLPGVNTGTLHKEGTLPVGAPAPYMARAVFRWSNAYGDSGRVEIRVRHRNGGNAYQRRKAKRAIAQAEKAYHEAVKREVDAMCSYSTACAALLDLLP